MSMEDLTRLSDSEKLLIFNLALEQARDNNKSFESQLGVVLTAFSLRSRAMNMAPKGVDTKNDRPALESIDNKKI